MKKSILLFTILVLGSCYRPEKPHDFDNGEEKIDYSDDAIRLSKELLIVDTHIDVPYRLEQGWEDISQRTGKGHFDYVRAKEGGLNAPFMSVYIPARYQQGGAREYADKLINQVYEFEERWPDKFRVATTPEMILDHFVEGLISLPMGMENGAPIETDINNIQYFYDRGIRYITLTHSKWNQICDSSYDPDKHWNGLSDFGKEVIKEMNRVGMMIDVSHVSDSAFYQILDISRAPVIASHSSCRYYTPGFERNMSDDMIRILASHGGVIQINFGSYFLDTDFQNTMASAYDYIDEHKLKWGSDEQIEYLRQYKIDHKVPEITIDNVVDHISHVTTIVGVDYIGLGSDFDGVNEVPVGLKDVSMYPNLIERLLEDGFSEEDIRKICAGNLFRVWNEVENTARSWNQQVLMNN